MVEEGVDWSASHGAARCRNESKLPCVEESQLVTMLAVSVSLSQHPSVHQCNKGKLRGN